MWKTRVQSLGQKDLLEKGMATHSSILAWRIPMDRGAWQATVHGVAKELDTTEQLNNKTAVCTTVNILKKESESEVTQSCLSLLPHELQHTRPPCSSLPPFPKLWDSEILGYLSV